MKITTKTTTNMMRGSGSGYGMTTPKEKKKAEKLAKKEIRKIKGKI